MSPTTEAAILASHTFACLRRATKLPAPRFALGGSFCPRAIMLFLSDDGWRILICMLRPTVGSTIIDVLTCDTNHQSSPTEVLPGPKDALALEGGLYTLFMLGALALGLWP